VYTRCSECGTVFRLTATVLQMAEGAVCCGNCGATFNALGALFDTPPGTQAASPALAPEQVDGEQEDRTGETLEFDVPEQEWNSFFTDTLVAVSDERAFPALGADFDEIAQPEPGEPPDETLVEPIEIDATPEPDTRRDEVGPADAEWPANAMQESVEGLVEPDSSFSTEPPLPEPPVEAEQAPAEEILLSTTEHRAGAGAAAGTAKRPATVLDWGVPDQLMQAPRAKTRRIAGWAFGSLIAALALAAQLVHYSRDALAADMRFGRAVRLAYARLNMPLYPAWPLDAYEIRGAEAIAGRTAAGTLDVVAQIAVKGRQPVGLPMVRLVLRDRWSNTVGSRVLSATEFLPQPQDPSRTYPPGAVIPVSISIADPGPAAQGYELDVCRPDRRRGLQCQSSGDPFRRTD
jgi:predicted Zn finger-like uncharacterized protein